MRRKNNYLVAVANNGKFRQRFMPGVPRTFDQDCSVLRGQCSDINQNIKRLVYCRYRKQSLTSVLSEGSVQIQIEI